MAKTKTEKKLDEVEKAAASAYKDANKASKLHSRLLAKADKLVDKANGLRQKVREEQRATETATGATAPAERTDSLGRRYGC